MKKLLLSTTVLLALSSAADAQTTGSSYVVCGNCAYAATTMTVCCSATVDDSTLASWAAKKAVESQQSSWWKGKVSDLSREEVDTRTARLTALKDWAKGLSNHIFAQAYCDWADQRLDELAERRKSLDQLDVALSLVKGLPVPPEGK
jgi:hypothetical protein